MPKLIKNHETLVAGPFVGELGHELFCWQGIIRALSRKYQKIVVYCGQGKSILYSDFADEVLEYAVKNYQPNGAFNDSDEVYPRPPGEYDYIGPNTALEDYDEHGFQNGLLQEYAEYGQFEEDLAYDYIIHCRATDKHQTGYRNWSVEKWQQLVSTLDGRIASIGSNKGSAYIPGTDNLLNMPIDKLVNVLRSSQFIIGPSSGPMHLASLCGTAQIVWSGDSFKNRARYLNDWNPLGSEVNYYPEDTWDPEVIDIQNFISDISIVKSV